MNLNRLQIRGLDIVVHMALSREVPSLVIPARIIDLTAAQLSFATQNAILFSRPVEPNAKNHRPQRILSHELGNTAKYIPRCTGTKITLIKPRGVKRFAPCYTNSQGVWLQLANAYRVQITLLAVETNLASPVDDLTGNHLLWSYWNVHLNSES